MAVYSASDCYHLLTANIMIESFITRNRSVFATNPWATDGSRSNTANLVSVWLTERPASLTLHWFTTNQSGQIAWLRQRNESFRLKLLPWWNLRTTSIINLAWWANNIAKRDQVPASVATSQRLVFSEFRSWRCWCPNRSYLIERVVKSHKKMVRVTWEEGANFTA